MRAGFAAAGPELLLELFSASKAYGFELQRTGARPELQQMHVSRTARAGAATGARARLAASVV